MRTIDTKKTRRIIDAAARLFAEKHYHEVRMEDIAAKAEVAKGTLYLHFKDKEALYVGLILDGAERICEKIEASCAMVTSPEEKLFRFVSESVQFLEEHPFFLQLITHAEAVEVDHQSTALPRHNSRMLNLVHDLLQEFPSLRQASAVDQELAVLSLVGQTREILRFLPHPWPDDLAERITRQYLHGVSPRLPDTVC